MGIINFVLYDYINNPCRVADGRGKDKWQKSELKTMSPWTAL